MTKYFVRQKHFWIHERNNTFMILTTNRRR